MRLRVPLEDERQRSNFITSTIEGMLAVAAIQAVANFVVIYAMELGATNAQVGLLVSIPFLANATALLLGSRYAANRSGTLLRPTLVTAAMHRVFVVIMVLASLMPPAIAVWWVLATYSLASACAAVTSTWWTAMVSEIFPAGNRGTIFGTRAMFTGGAGVVATLVAGRSLDLMPFPRSFTVVFFSAAACGFLAVRFLADLQLPEVQDTVHESSPANRIRHRDVLRGEAGRAFLGFALPVFLFNMGFYLVTPVQNIYFVERLQLSKGHIGLLTSAFLACQVLSSRFWGRLGDRIGPQSVACICMTLLAIQAAVYSLLPSLPFLLLVQGLGGLAFGGYLMAQFNGIIAIGDAQSRPVLVSLFNVMGGLGSFLSPPIGTALLAKFDVLPTYLVAMAMRTVGALVMLRAISAGLGRQSQLQHRPPTVEHRPGG